VDEEPAHHPMLVVSAPDADSESPLQGVPEWKPQQKILWIGVLRESGRGRASGGSGSSLPMGGAASRS